MKSFTSAIKATSPGSQAAFGLALIAVSLVEHLRECAAFMEYSTNVTESPSTNKGAVSITTNHGERKDTIDKYLFGLELES